MFTFRRTLKRIATYALFVLLCLVAVPSIAQQYWTISDTIAHEIHFRWDKSRLDTLYLGNDRVFKQIAEHIDSVGIDKIDSIVIVSQSSPEGPYLYNQNLSKRRAATMRAYMQNHHPEIIDRLTVNPDGESWEQLRRYVATDTKMKDESKRRLLQIIDDDSISIQVKKRRISKDPLYRYIYTTYYPIIRNSRIEIVYHNTIYKKEPLMTSSVAFRPLQMEYSITRSPLPSPSVSLDTLVFALKTNLLYDAVSALNFEVELPIGNHWSVAVEDVFPWWERGNKYCLQMWEMGAEARYWFSKNTHYVDKLRGHFLGAYAMSSKFDFQYDYDICYQGEYWSAGLTYGYSLRLSRHLNMEFSLSVGWLSAAYRHYYPADDYSLLWRDKSKVGRIGYFGPTKLKISLMLPVRVPYKKRGGAL